MDRVTVSFRRVSAEVTIPRYQTDSASGMDLAAHLPHDLSIPPGEVAVIPTGLIVAIPEGYEGQVRPRSGLARKHRIAVLNAPGTIDADYRGEVEVILMNFGKEPFLVRPGDRVAQLVIAGVARAELTETESLPETKRGAGGFGHTGVRS
jgi:dUTP pyrophosphatase